MSGNGDYGAVREDVLAETRERARRLASQGLLAREIERRLERSLTATERELLCGIVRQEVTLAHRAPGSRQHANLRRPESSAGGPNLLAARERWEEAKRRAWGRVNGGRAGSALAVVPVTLAAVAVGVLLGLVLASGGHQRGATSPRVGAVGMHRPGPTSRGKRGAEVNSRRRSASPPHKSSPVRPPVTPSSGGRHQSTQESQIGAASVARLNDRGFQLMKAGRYEEAIPLLRRAVSAAPPQSNDLTYAYALFNLGRSLRLVGRSQEAIPLLERRLRLNNQRATVARELEAARRRPRSTGGTH